MEDALKGINVLIHLLKLLVQGILLIMFVVGMEHHVIIENGKMLHYRTKLTRKSSEFLYGCIITGNGCILNTGCEAALAQQACDKTLTGIQCHFDGSKCKVKTYEIAGHLYNRHKACNNFMPYCTEKVNASSGCMQISCFSSPIMYNTDELCKAYLPNHNCITKKGGRCNYFMQEIDCVKDCAQLINPKLLTQNNNIIVYDCQIAITEGECIIENSQFA